MGSTGSGKSFAAKRELLNVFLTIPQDRIIVVDPMGEYAPLCLLYTSMTDKKEHIRHSMKSTAPADCVTEIRIGNSVLVVSGFFKQGAKETAARCV